MGTVELDPAALRKLGKPEFERFCCDVVLRTELERRHRWPWKEPDGPSGGVGETDGGRDFSLEIEHLPRLPLAQFPYAITADELGLTWYSCKNTKSESNARQLVLRDLQLSKSNLKKLWPGGEPPTELLEGCTRDGRLSKQLLEVLAGGGRYFVLLGVQTAKKSDLCKDVVAKLEAWCKDLLGLDVELSQQVRIIDANDLARFINHHQVKIPKDLELVLGIESPVGLAPWEDWFDRFDADRGLPPFELDQDRQRKIADINLQTSLEPGLTGVRYSWIAGPPGMGKTRLVLHALEQVPEHARRVLFTEDPDAALQALLSPWFKSVNDAILVVDECSDIRVDELIDVFGRNNGARRNSLMLIGPLPENIEKPRRAFRELSPLPNAAIRKLIRDVANISLDDATLDHLTDLVGGYPHYAVLLARELEPEEADLLSRMSRWEVAQRALAGRPSAPEEVWRRNIESRAKALLAVAIAPRLPWDDLDPATEDALGRALHLEFLELREAAKHCEKRGLLRHVKSQGHQYISPKLLGGIILDHFLGDGPGGPGLGPRIKRELPDRFGDLCRSVQRYGASPDIQRSLALLDLADPDAHTWGRLDMLAHWHPELSVRSLPRLFAQHDPDEILSSDHIDIVFSAIMHLSLHPIDFDQFEIIEDALFGLAIAESRHSADHGRHSSTDPREIVYAWEGLFAPNATHQPFAARLAILERRSRDVSPEVRLAVVHAIVAAADPRLAASDGFESGPLLHECLLSLIDDRDENVVNAVRRALATTLRARLASGATSAELRDLAERAKDWTSSHKRLLQDELDDFHRYDDEERVRSDPERNEALEALEAALEVEDLVDRVTMRIGRWVPDFEVDTHEHQPHRTRDGDQALARELLEAPSRWAEVLGWLEQPEAARAADFLRALGVTDEHDLLLAPLAARLASEESSRNLAKYLQGRHERLGDEETDAWIAAALPHPPMHGTVARLLSLLPGSDERLEAIVALLRDAGLDSKAREILGHSPWSSRGSISARGLRAASRQALGLRDVSDVVVVFADALLRADDGPMEAELVDGFAEALGAYATSSSRWSILRRWQNVARQLFAMGRVSLVLEMLVDVLASEDARSTRAVLDMLAELLEHVSPQQFWEALRPSLGSRRLISRFHYSRRGIMPLCHISEDEALTAAREDPSIALALGQLSQPYEDSLEPLASRLISELGANGPAARAIAARARSAPRMVHSFGHFHQQQAERARAWARTSDLEVRRWAESLAEWLEATAADELVSESFERKLG